MEKNLIIQLCGLPGVGKSYIADKIHEEFDDSCLVSIRNIRRSLGHRGYFPDRNKEVFQKVYDTFVENMQLNRLIIFDSNETQKARRIYTANMANSFLYQLVTIECFCDETLAKQRMSKRDLVDDELFEDSNNPTVYDTLKLRWQEISQEELGLSNYFYMKVDTGTKLISWEKKLDSLEGLDSFLFKIL